MGTLDPASSLAPNYYDGCAAQDGDVRLNTKLFTYSTDQGVVAGATMNILCKIKRPAKVVWPIFKDLNLWQNDAEHFYSRVVGDSEGEMFYLEERARPDRPAPDELESYEVIRSIPEYLFVITQPVLEDRVSPGLPGLGGVRPGFHVFMLNEHGGECVVTITLEHASYAAHHHDITDEEALAPWHELVVEGQTKWLDSFIPVLKRLADEAP